MGQMTYSEAARQKSHVIQSRLRWEKCMGGWGALRPQVCTSGTESQPKNKRRDSHCGIDRPCQRTASNYSYYSSSLWGQNTYIISAYRNNVRETMAAPHFSDVIQLKICFQPPAISSFQTVSFYLEKTGEKSITQSSKLKKSDCGDTYSASQILEEIMEQAKP